MHHPVPVLDLAHLGLAHQHRRYLGLASAFLLEPLPLALEVYSQTIPKTVVLAQQQLLTLSQKLDSEVHLGS